MSDKRTPNSRPVANSDSKTERKGLPIRRRLKGSNPHIASFGVGSSDSGGLSPSSTPWGATSSLAADGRPDLALHVHRKLSRISPLDPRSTSSTVLKKLGEEELKTVKSHTELADTANGVRMLVRNLAKARIHLDVRAIMIVTKARDNSLIPLTREVVVWLLDTYDDIVVYVDRKLMKLKRFNMPSIYEQYPQAKDLLRWWDKDLAFKNPEKLDLVVTLGGDGTVLYVSNLFQRVVPPVISFSLGSLGFLTNFKFDRFREKMSSVVDNGVKAYMRMRFTCRVHKADGRLVCEQQVLNELVVDRGPSAYLTQLELYGDGALLTVAQADGLIIATPTGSTAYSLSAGGSLVHPSVSAISVTPICPHTLSFRPILLPDGMFLKIKVPQESRANAWASFDGKLPTELSTGDYVTVQASPYPFPTVIASRNEYIDSVSRNLKWNNRERQKPMKSFYARDQETPSVSDDEKNDEHFDINASSDSLASDTDADSNRPYLPPPGTGISTPPNNATVNDERQCYAHPNAKVSLEESASGHHNPIDMSRPTSRTSMSASDSLESTQSKGNLQS